MWLLTITLPTADAAQTHRPALHLPSLSQIVSWITGPAWGKLPRQVTGTAGGHGHAASAASTRANRGSGHGPGKGRGQLAPYAPLKRLVKHGLSGSPEVGFVAATSTRDAAKSTADSDLYRNADGTFTRRIWPGPVNYKDPAGHWQPISTSVAKGPDGRWHEQANSLTVDYASKADAPVLVHLGFDSSHGLSYSLAGAAPVGAVASGSTVTFAGVLPQTDLVLQPTASGSKESIVLRSAAAANSWTFPLALTGLTPVLAAAGSIDLVDASGNTVAVMPKAYAYDSNIGKVSGEPATTDAVSYQLTTTAAGPALVATLDPAWLSDPSRVFPVTVDPTLNLQVTTTYAESGYPGDHSSENVIKVGSYNSGTNSANSFLQFPNSGLDGSKVVVSYASLDVFDSWASTCTAERFDVAAVTQAWTPSGVTSYPGPSRGASIGNATPSVPQACANTAGDRSVGDWVTVPLATATIQGWANGTTADYGLAMYAVTTDNLHWKQFGSIYDPGYGPSLAVTYTGVVLPVVSSQFPGYGFAAGTLTPQLSASGQIDPLKAAGSLKFDFQVTDSSGTKVVDSGLVSGGSNSYGAAGWTVPAGKLKWGSDYYWTVQSYDGTNYSPAPIWNALRIQVPQLVVTSGLSQNSSKQGFDPAIGNYTTEATDAQVSTVGPSLSVVRDYNSRDPRTGGAFGAAWSSVFDAKATEQYGPSGAVASVVVTYPDGSQVGYGKNADGTFTPPQGRFATFKSITGGYSLTDKNDTVYTFTQSLGAGGYGITSIADASSRTESFTWTAGQISAVTSVVSGRALHLTWSTPTGATSAHIATVSTDPVTAGQPATALTWTYGYSADELTSVCPPGTTTACTKYGYTPGSQYGNQVLDQGANSLWPLAEPSGTTAASAVLSNEGTDNATYSGVTLGQPGPLAGSSATAAGFNGSSSLVALPNLGIYNTTNESISLWFKTSVAPGVLVSASDGPITATSTIGNFDPVLYVGSDGKLNGLLWAQIVPAPIVTAASVADGKWHHVVLAGSYNAQTMWVDGRQVGTAAGAGSLGFAPATEPWLLGHNYLGTGFLGAQWPDQPHPNSTTVYATYFNGSIADAAYFSRALTQGDVTGLYAAGSQPAPLLSSITLPSGKTRAAVTYDPVTATVTQVTDENGGTWQLAAPTVSGSSEVYRAAVLGAGPVGYWRFGEPAGALQAASQVNYAPGTYANVTLGAASGFQDVTAASFNGTSSYVALPAGLITGAGNQSLSLWFKTTANNDVLFGSSKDPITAGTTPGNYTPELYIGPGGFLNAEFYNGTTSPVLSNGAVNDGKWHNVVLAAGISSQSLYVDGKLCGSLSGTISGSGQPNVYVGAGFIGGNWPNEPHHLQSGNTGYATYFNGTIGDVAFYNSQLSGPAVTTEYAAARSSAGVAPVMTVRITDPGGKTVTNEYDPLNGNRMTAVIDALGHKTTYGYDSSGFLNTVTDPNGNVSTTGHDVRGNKVSETSCQNQAASACSTVYYTYFPDDTTAQLTTADPRNDVALTVRDGRSASASDNTYLTSYSYDPSGNETGVTTPAVPGFPNGRTTSITYSDGTSAYPAADTGNVPAGLPVKVVSPGGAVSQMSYYSDGDVAKTTNANGLTTSFTYDNLGRVQAKTEVSDSYPAGLTTSYTFDGQGRVLTQTDPPITNRVTGAIHTAQTTTVYDPDGNITSQTVSDLTGGDLPRTNSTTYNQYDQVASTTDAANVTTSYGYDAYGNKIREVDGNNVETDSAYDPNGHLLTATLIGYTGDPANPSPATNLIEASRAYDPSGRLASQTDSMGNTTYYTYADNGLMATVTRKNAAGTASFTVESDFYDAAGNKTRQVTNNGATTTSYTVDAASRTTSSVLDPAGVDRVTSVSYTPDDQPVTTTRTDSTGATQVVSATFDPMGNMTSQSLYADVNGHPVGWWRLNQASGTAVPDASGTGNTATAANVTWSGGAGTFNGTSSVVATNGPVLNTASSFTVSAWADLTGNTTSYQAVVSERSAVQSGFGLIYDSATGKWGFGRALTDTTTSATPTAESASAVQVGTWTHLVGTFDATTGTLTLYVNGAQSGNTATDTTPFAASGALAIGQAMFSGTLGDWFTGQIANVQAYQRVLSPAEITALYVAGRSGGTTASSSELTTAWTLDQRGLPTAMTDSNGNVTGYSYDEAGRLVVTTDAAVNAETGGGTPVLVHPVTSAGYNTFGEKTETQDPNGNVKTTAYDPNGRPVSVTLPAYTPPGSTTPITAVAIRQYDNIGQVVADTDPVGNQTTFTYDQLGDPATVTAPNAGVTHYTYDTNGDKLSATGPTGAVAQATYDFLGRQLTATSLDRYPVATTSTTTSSYAASTTNPGGAWLASVTSQNGVVTSYGHNSAGETVSVTDGASNKTSYQYDFLGRKTIVTAADGTSSAASYDQAGNPVASKQFDALGNALTSQSATFDGAGNMLSATDARGNTSTFTYDASGQLTQEVQPVTTTSAITTSFGYDAAGNKTRFTDGRGNNWITTFNSWNLPESVIEPSTPDFPTAAVSTFTTAYDANGRPVSQTLPGGVTVTAGYDQLGNLVSQQGSGADAATASRSFGYDLAGRMTSASTTAAGSAPATSLTFGYNDRGLLLSATGTAGSSSFGYNADALMTSRTDAAGTTTYGYDNAGRLSTLGDAATGASLVYSYNQLNQVSQVQYGTAADVRTFGYDSLHRLLSDALKTSAGAQVASVSYGYDANGNLTSKTTAGFAGSAANTYTYDAANRLTSWNNGTATTGYGYDASGNRTQVGSAAYAYDARDQLTSSGTSTYTYTARGTMASQVSAAGTTSYSFDSFGQQVTAGARGYAHDALGRVVSATATSGPVFALSYSGSGITPASDGVSTYSQDPSGSVVGVGAVGQGTSAGVLAFTDLHTDVTGNFTASGGSLTGSAAYDPLGDVTATGGVVAGLLGFQSGWTDPASGQVSMGSRWYSPGSGQFTSRDSVSVSPVPDSVAANPFAYAGQDPMTRIDPLGTNWFSDVVSSAWHHITRAVSSGWHAVTQVASSAWNATSSWLSSTWDAEIAAMNRTLAMVNQWVNDGYRALKQATSWVGRKVAGASTWVYHHAASVVKTAWHEVKQVAKATGSFLKSHEAAIVSFAAGAVVFGGCMAATWGVGSVGCAVMAGAAGNLVGYAMTCGSAAGGCSVAGALVSAGTGAIAGLIGGAIAGPLGGKLASSVLGRVLPDLVVEGLAGAGAGGAAGGAAGAVNYGLSCGSSKEGCSLSGFASATGESALGGAITGGALAFAGGAAGRLLGRARGAGCGGESFSAGTKVLAASGALVPISELRAGQKVVATSTGTGKTGAAVVAAVLVRHDTDLYRLKVKAAGRTAVIETTAAHPFWDVTQRRWVKAGALKYGDYLRTPGGTGTVTVAGGWTPASHDGWMWDLTVPGPHDFYVGTAGTAILVHNCGEGGTGGSPEVGGSAPEGGPSHIAAGPGDRFFTTQDEAKGAAMEAHGVAADSPVDARVMYGKNPNLTGPKGQPWEQLDALDPEGNIITIDHHANGHFFEDNNTWSLPHYHGPNGEHFWYGNINGGYGG